MKRINRTWKTLIFSFLSIFILSIMLTIPAMVFAQTEEEEAEDQQLEEEVEPAKVTFDIPYPEVRAKSGSTFEFKADLSFSGDEDTTFDIVVEAPQGWYVSVQPSYQASEISAIKLNPGSSESLKVVATPLVKMEPGDYTITLTAENEDLGLSATTDLVAVVTATYQLDLNTKSGRLSTEITSGKDNKYILLLKNNSSTSVENITLSASEPEGWTVTFDQDKIETLAADGQEEIEATIKPPEKTIAGDYMITFNVNSENSTDSLELRATVLTPTLWGWVGIGIIVIVIVGVAIIFARLGRR